MKMKNKPVQTESHRHHYIPQFLIRNFSDRGDGFVRYYSIKTKKIKNMPTEDIFVYFDLYRDEKNNPDNPVKIESDLAKFEGEIAKLLKEKFYKGNEISLTFEEEDKLKLFIAIMMYRNAQANKVFSDKAPEEFKEKMKEFLPAGDPNDIWKKNLGYLVNCRSLQEVIDHPDIDDFFRHSVFFSSFGFFGTFLIVAERRGSSEFVLGDSFPYGHVSVADDNMRIPLFTYFPISPERIIIVASNLIKETHPSARVISESLLRKPTISNGGIKITVKKIYEKDVDFINGFAFKTAKDGVAFRNEENIQIL